METGPDQRRGLMHEEDIWALFRVSQQGVPGFAKAWPCAFTAQSL